LIEGFYSPVLKITSNGKDIVFSKVCFDSSLTGLLLRVYMANEPEIEEGAIIKGELTWAKNKTDLLFTCVIEDVLPDGQRGFEIVAREKYFNPLNTPLSTTTWRDSNLDEILADILDMASVGGFDISNCPSYDIPRFSIPNGFTGLMAINILFGMVKLSGGEQLEILPLPDGTLVVGAVADIRLKMSSTIVFDSAQNIISRFRNEVAAFALPVLANQEITIDSSNYLCNRSVLTVTPGKYRIAMEVEEL